MVRVFLTGLLFLFSVIVFAQTQLEMNEAAHKNYLKTDKLLNTIYQKILIEYKMDSIFIKNLKAAQKTWIKFRDDEMSLKYPKREPGYYGSVHNMCWFIYKRELTQERITKLNHWVIGEEDTSCTSSIKTNK